jgi:hypothetical protein
MGGIFSLGSQFPSKIGSDIFSSKSHSKENHMDNLNVSHDVESNEARHPEEGISRGAVAPKIKTRPIESPSNDFWDSFGTAKQPSNQDSEFKPHEAGRSLDFGVKRD